MASRKRKTRKVLPAKRRKKPKSREPKLSNAELKRQIRELKKELEVAKFFKDFVDAEEPGWLHKDRTLAMQYSSLRHRGKLTSRVMSALRKASRKNESAFRQEANHIAIFFDIPVKEVYTLWFSP